MAKTWIIIYTRVTNNHLHRYNVYNVSMYFTDFVRIYLNITIFKVPEQIIILHDWRYELCKDFQVINHTDCITLMKIKVWLMIDKLYKNPFWWSFMKFTWNQTIDPVWLMIDIWLTVLWKVFTQHVQKIIQIETFEDRRYFEKVLKCSMNKNEQILNNFYFH